MGNVYSLKAFDLVNPLGLTDILTTNANGGGISISNLGGITASIFYGSASGLSIFGSSGASHKPGIVPDPGSIGGTSKYLREDATWQTITASSGTVYYVGLSLPNIYNVSTSSVISSGTLTAAFNTQASGTFLRGPNNTAVVGTPTFGILVQSDIPNIAEYQVTNLVSDLALKAPLDSPSLIGIPTAPTAALNTNTTQIATTAFVSSATAALVNSAPSTLDTLKELSDALGADPNFATTITNSLALKAPLVSPTFTGTPAGPTATGGTNTTQIATCAFVTTAVSNVTTTSIGAVPTSRLINTSAPITGGGDLSVNRTISILQATSIASGYLSSVDWQTFNSKLATTRNINTTVPITGGGDLSSDRTIAIPVATSSVDGYLSADRYKKYNSTSRVMACINFGGF